MDTVYVDNLAFRKYVDSIKITRSEVLTYREFVQIVENEYNCQFIIGSLDHRSHLRFRNPADATLFLLKWG